LEIGHCTLQIANSAQYCREIESYLCRKNDGHLIRIVGPAFELVTSWATRGIPLKIAWRGIDRTFERYYAKGPRRRPVRVEFCEADILDVFDEWRRTVGIGLPGPEIAPVKSKASLSQHLDRVIARLTAHRGGDSSADLDRAIDEIVLELDAQRLKARTLRGEARAALIARLEELDTMLLERTRASAPPGMISDVDREAGEDLASFRERMTEDAYAQARAAARDRLLRERLHVPTLRFAP
jgi:hypothetical protein